MQKVTCPLCGNPDAELHEFDNHESIVACPCVPINEFRLVGSLTAECKESVERLKRIGEGMPDV